MKTLRTYRILLGNRPLTRLLAGEFISSIGDWLYLVALLIVVYQRSGDPVLLGVVGAARVLPYVVLSVPAGLAADRLDRRLILMATDLARGVIMLGLAWLVATNGPLEAIVALAIIATCFSTFFGPTIGAYLPSLVADERQLGPANSAWATLDNLAFVVGPATAGLLIAVGGLTLAFLLNAASFAVVASVLWRLPSSRGHSEAVRPGTGSQARDPSPPIDPADPPGDAAEGPAAVTRDAGTPGARVNRRVVLGLGLMEGVDGLASGGVGVLTVILATTTYGAGDAGTGYLNAAMGVGGLIGALVSGALVLRASLGPALWAGGLAMGLGLAALGPTNQIAVALVALTITSAGSLVLEVASATLFQRAVPDELRGRALGAMATSSTLAFAGGSLLAPLLADLFGTTALLIGTGAMVAIATATGRIMVGTSVVRPTDRTTEIMSRVARLPILAGVSAVRLEAAIAHLRARPVGAGEVVIRQGDPADGFFVIADGRFLVTQHEATRAPAAEERTLREMGPDEVFGEIGLLRHTARTASVTALTNGLLLELDGRHFLELVGSASGLGARLLYLHRGSLTGESRPAEVSAV